MRNARNLLLISGAAFFLWLGAAGTALVSPAAAGGFNSWEGADETVESPAAAFLKKHGKLIFGAVPVVMFVLYILIMGPADVAGAVRHTGGMHRHRGWGRGFGSNGGFGGNITTKNPWE